MSLKYIIWNKMIHPNPLLQMWSIRFRRIQHQNIAPFAPLLFWISGRISFSSTWPMLFMKQRGLGSCSCMDSPILIPSFRGCGMPSRNQILINTKFVWRGEHPLWPWEATPTSGSNQKLSRAKPNKSWRTTTRISTPMAISWKNPKKGPISLKLWV